VKFKQDKLIVKDLSSGARIMIRVYTSKESLLKYKGRIRRLDL